MRTIIILFLAISGVAAGCRANRSIDSSPLGPPLKASAAAVVLPPPAPTNEVVLHFEYPVWPLTNGYLESSTDLVHWINRDDFTNDDAGNWHIRAQPEVPVQFFRAGGQTIP